MMQDIYWKSMVLLVGVAHWSCRAEPQTAKDTSGQVSSQVHQNGNTQDG